MKHEEGEQAPLGEVMVAEGLAKDDSSQDHAPKEAKKD